MTQTQTLAQRLALVLAEVTSLTDKEAEVVTSEALALAHTDVGCGLREELALIVVRMGEQVTDLCHADHADLCRFYDEESTFKDSDHKPSDCRKWSKQHGLACEAFGKANLAVLKARLSLDKRLGKADL